MNNLSKKLAELLDKSTKGIENIQEQLPEVFSDYVNYLILENSVFLGAVLCVYTLIIAVLVREYKKNSLRISNGDFTNLKRIEGDNECLKWLIIVFSLVCLVPLVCLGTNILHLLISPVTAVGEQLVQ